MNTHKTLTMTFNTDGTRIESITTAIATQRTGKNGKRYHDDTDTTQTRTADNVVMSDIVASYCMHKSVQFAFTAVKNVLSNEWTEKMYSIYCSLAYIMDNGYTVQNDYDVADKCERFKQWYHENKRTLFDVNDRLNNDSEYSKRYNVELLHAQNGTTHTVKHHTYTMRTLSDGKRHRVECLPFDTIERTAYGRMTDEQKTVVYDNDANDVIQVAVESMLMLYKCGIINSFSDFMHYRYFVYRRINRYISRQRKHDNIKATHVETCDDSGSKLEYQSIKSIDAQIERVEKNAVHECIIDIIKTTARKNHNVDNIVATYVAHYMNDWTEQRTADALRVDIRQVQRYKKTIQKLLASDTVRDALRDIMTA